jgi:hypothetical protein
METKKLKWWQMRRTKLTKQYGAGIIAGLGMGLAIAWSFPGSPDWGFVVGRTIGIVITSIGSIMAYHDQQQVEKINQTA